MDKLAERTASNKAEAPDERKFPNRWATVKNGVVMSVKDMQGGVEPRIYNEDKSIEVVQVGADVRAGMVKGKDGKFAFPEEAPPAPKNPTKRQEVLGETTEPRTVRNHPTKTGTPAAASNKQPSEKTKAQA